jgi:hypothetical protein
MAVRRSVRRAKSRKRKAPTMTKETIEKILKNPKTPKQLRPYWQKRLDAMK